MSILDKASLVITPTAYKEDKLYSIIPRDGSGDLTWTRATDGTRINKDGFIENTPYNLLSYSEKYDVVNWDKTQSTIITGATISPDNKNNASKIVSNLYTGRISLGQTKNNLQTGYTYTASVYLKAAEWSHATVFIDQVGVQEGAYYGSWANLNLTAGTSSHPSIVTLSPYIDGWYKAVIKCTITENRFALKICPKNSQVVGVNNIIGDGVSGIYVCGAQLIEGDEPKQYLPTINRQDVPRITYPTTGGTPSILIEPQRTNLIVKSEELNDNTTWFTTNATILSNIITAPNGILNADKLMEDAGVGGVHRFYNQIISTSTGNTYTFTIYAKAGERSVFYIDMRSTNAVGKYMYSYNLTTKAITKIGSDDAVSTKIEDVGNGWYRCSITSVVNDPNAYVVIYMTNGSTNVYVGESGYGMYFWGLQYEQGTNPTSYIPTTNATVTRNADVVEKTNISDLIGQTEGTLFADFNYEKNDPDDNFIAILSDNSSNNGVWIDVNNSNQFVAIIRAGGVSSVSFLLSAANFQFGRKKIAFSYKSGATSLYINGAKIGVTNTNAFTFNNTVSKFNLGCYWNNSSQLNNTINSSAIFKQALTDAECITLTTL